jgi:hypothetical protein
MLILRVAVITRHDCEALRLYLTFLVEPREFVSAIGGRDLSGRIKRGK